MNAMPLSIDDVTEQQLAKAIDHSLLRPELDDDFIAGGCRLAAEYDVALGLRPSRPTSRGRPSCWRGPMWRSARSSASPTAVQRLQRSSPRPARRSPQAPPSSTWSSTSAPSKSGRDERVAADIGAVVDVAHAAGAIVKVILENAYLTDDEKVRGCRAAESAGADFVKTSTGFAPGGATHEDLALMRRTVSAPRPGQGGRGRSHPRRPVGRHGARRDARRRHAAKPILDEYRARRAGATPNAAPAAPRRVLTTNQRGPTTRGGRPRRLRDRRRTHDGTGCPRWRRPIQGEGVKAR